MKKRLLIAGVGEVLWDIYPDARYLGGAIFNFIHHVIQLEHEGLLVSRLGNDKEGKELLEILQSSDFNTKFIQVDDHNPTGSVTVSLDENKIPSFIASKNGAYYFLEWDESYLDVAPNVDAVLFGTFTQRFQDVKNITKRFITASEHALKVFDVNFRWWDDTLKYLVEESLHFTDILKLNEEEYNKLCGYFPEMNDRCTENLLWLQSKFDIMLVCLTLGEKGCLLSDRSGCVYCPGLEIDAVDTTGAGDAFIASLTISYLNRESLAGMGAKANSVAAYTASLKGASPVYTLSEVKKFRSRINDYVIEPEFEHLISH